MLYQSFNVAGVINVETLDAGLISPVDVPIHLNAVIINSSATEGNRIQGWIGTHKVMEIYDYNCDTQEESAAQHPLSSVKLGRIPLDMDIPPGKIFKVGVACGATANNLFGAYEFTQTT